MAYEVFRPPAAGPKYKRLAEVLAMLETLEADPELTARIDMDRTNVHEMARRLGYRVTVTDNKDGTVNVVLRARA